MLDQSILEGYIPPKLAGERGKDIAIVLSSYRQLNPIQEWAAQHPDVNIAPSFEISAPLQLTDKGHDLKGVIMFPEKQSPVVYHNKQYSDGLEVVAELASRAREAHRSLVMIGSPKIMQRRGAERFFSEELPDAFTNEQFDHAMSLILEPNQAH